MCFFTFSTKIQIDLSHGGMHDWWRALFVYFHSRVWHTICHSPKMVYFTAQECEENEGGMCNVFKYINEFFQAISSISEVFLRILYNKSTYDCLNLKHKTPLSYKKSKTRVF